ncbi:protein Z-dependent protease inhibitor-like [Hippocampus zosterae]|uniref:protein Z-dependent protease inhibitor-like n=1 Tax=Hippocampus zosterae TaxID=109293 RepID=UPI00223CBB53|nr:protein Z-dependent protease inhibitor-like [Hippocampus zosterae]
MRSGPLTLLAVLGLAVPLASLPADDDAVRDLIGRSCDFSTRLYRALASRGDDNVLLSTASVWRGLTALLAAAGGATREELRTALGLAGLDPQNITDALSTITSTPAGGGALNLRQGVALFADAGAQASAQFEELLRRDYGGDVKSADFHAPRDAAEAVNAWVRQQIGDRVQDAVTDVDPGTKWLLATAASYQARFSQPFNASATRDERFYVDRYHVVTVPMMLRADKYLLAYDRSLRAGVLKLPMTDGAAALLVLPDEDVDIGALEEQVSREKIRAWIGQLKKTKLEVQLPRFFLDRTYSLGDALRTLGVVRVFGDDAEGPEGAKVSQVLHKAVAAVDESGPGDAAAAPAFASPPPRLTFNRPFHFVVYHQSSGALLLMGRLRDPTKK